MKKKIIAKNALSQNLARLLHNDDKNPKILLKSINDLIAKLGKNGIKISKDTILSWIEVKGNSMIECKKWPTRESLIPVADVLGISYLELYIPNSYIKYSDLSADKRSIINSVISADDKLSAMIKLAVRGVTREEIKKIDIDSEKKKNNYQRILTLLDSEN